MIRAFFLFVTLAGVSLGANANLTTYVGSGVFDDGVSFDFTFEWDDATNPTVGSASTSDGMLLADIVGFGTENPPLRLGEILFSNLRTTDNVLTIIFTPPIDSLSDPAALSGWEQTRTGSTVRTIVQGSVERAASVPLPATLALLGLGLACLGWSRRR